MVIIVATGIAVFAMQYQQVTRKDTDVEQQTHGSANSIMLNTSGVGVTIAAMMKMIRIA